MSNSIKKVDKINVKGIEYPIYRFHTLSIGSGAASLRASIALWDEGITNIAIVTEGIGKGASYNSGSDKQTYYRLSTDGKLPDSPLLMAEAMMKGGSAHGDISLIEAIGSTEAFYYLQSIGMKFPKNQYGAYVGYQTDHDNRGRGTSVGPYTSKHMVEVLLKQVRERRIPILNQFHVVSLLYMENRIFGVLAIDESHIDAPNYGINIILASNVIFGTGGPGGLYRDSVYPKDQIGSIGLALEIGAEAANLTESQFGLASKSFRWNVSGSYMQVIPSFFSTDKEGNDRKEFLQSYFPSFDSMCHAIFLKGYQWPFHANKVLQYGSSLIDILVYRETIEFGRRVFLDFQKNPSWLGEENLFSMEILPKEVQEYLVKSDAVAPTPFERLLRMNPSSIALFKVHGIDIGHEPLEIAIAAQHNNGGLAVDTWWESTNIKHLFPVGEVAGTHGVTRPGGSALNAGQVGAMRAAQKIARDYQKEDTDHTECIPIAIEEAIRIKQLIDESFAPIETTDEYIAQFKNRMSDYGAIVRSNRYATIAVDEAKSQTATFNKVKISDRKNIITLMNCRHLVLSHCAYLQAIKDYLDLSGGSRGSYLVLASEGTTIHNSLEQKWKYVPENVKFRNLILITRYVHGSFISNLIDTRPIPKQNLWFESVWKEYTALDHKEMESIE